jgi:hypothetical protein
MLANKYMPAFDVREHHEARVAAPAGEAYAALRSFDFSRSFTIRLLFAIRTLPSRLRGRISGAPKGPLLEQVLASGWVILEELPGSELIAGTVTRPWEPVVKFRGLPREQFATFAEPGFAKIVWAVSALPVGPSSSIIFTETRVQTTDPASRRRFRFYWLVFGLGIRLIRWLALRMIRRDFARLRNDG